MRVFISYKWEDESHNKWVQKFASDLRAAGIDAMLDVWEVRYGDSFTHYMTSKITEADVVLFIMTSRSVKAVEAPTGEGGAVKFEIQMATSRRTAGEKMRLIGVYREGDATPAHLRDHRYADFRDDSQYEIRLNELIDDLREIDKRPPIQANFSSRISAQLEDYLSRGEKYEQEGDFEKAISHYDLAVKLNPANASPFLKRGDCYSRFAHCDQAAADYKRALELNPGMFSHTDLYKKCAECYLNAAKRSWRVADFNKAISEYRLAIKEYSRLIELEPNNAEYYYSRGKICHQSGQYDQAIADFQSAIRLQPDKADFYAARGESYLAKSYEYRKSHYSKALVSFTRSIRLNPDQADYYKRRGDCWVFKRKADKAIEDYDRAIQLAPDDASLYGQRAKCYLAAYKDYHKALADLNHAIGLEPNNADYYAWRSYVYDDGMGEREAAQNDRSRHRALGGKHGVKGWHGIPFSPAGFKDY